MHKSEVTEMRIWKRPDGSIAINTTESRPSGTTAEVFANVPKASTLYKQLDAFLDKRQS